MLRNAVRPGHAIKCRVVKDEGLAVGTEAYIGLDLVDRQCQSPAKSRKAVFWPELSAPTMGSNDSRLRRIWHYVTRFSLYADIHRPKASGKEVTMNKAKSSAVAIRAGVAVAVTVAGFLLIAYLAGSAAYDWIKALHVIAIISWMAGMLYLPRLFIYHCEAERGSKQSETFKVMEGRLLRVIINPAMIIAWVLGLWLAWQSGFWRTGWFGAKFAAVLGLSAVHGYFSAAVRAFAEDRNTRNQRHWRIVNEVPTALMIVIVILVIVKPF